MVEAKRALSREEQQTNSRSGNINPTRNSGHVGSIRTKKVFVGGLPATMTDEQFRQYFESFWQVTNVVIMYDQTTQRPRGFGFISFDSEDAVDQVLHKTFHDLNGKQVEVKRALPGDANPGGGSRSMGGGSGGGGSCPGFGASGGNSGSYYRMDSSRYMQTQNAGGGYPDYGTSGYSTPAMGMVPAMVLDTLSIMAVLALDMGLVELTETQIYEVLAMQVVLLVDLEVDRHLLLMVRWVIGMLALGALQAPAPPLVVLVQHLLVNLQVVEQGM
ncbi:nuclear ribonucleoprotein 1 [Orobanche hederae]